MRLLKILCATVLLAIPVAALADARDVPGSAEWYLHIDLDKMRSEKAGEAVDIGHRKVNVLQLLHLAVVPIVAILLIVQHASAFRKARCNATLGLKWERNALRARPWRTEFFGRFGSEISTHEPPVTRVLELGSGPGFLAHHLLQ